MRRGLALVEGLIAGFVIVALAAAMVWAVLDAHRRAEDTQTLADVRALQAAAERHRHLNGAYPDAAELTGVFGRAGGYRGMPEGCASVAETVCRSYEISFALSGNTGGLSGGDCVATPSGVTCEAVPR